MEMIPPGQPDLGNPAEALAVRGKFKFPNLMIFPRELREAIPPEYDSRALVFDSVSGSKGVSPTPVGGMAGEHTVDWGKRTRVEFLVHETGKLDGKFTIAADLDAATARALGQFLIDLANASEA